MTTKAETGVMQPEVRDCQQPQEVGKEEEGSSLELSEGAWPCQNLDSGLPNSRTEQTDFGCFKPASLWCLLMAATGNSYGQ